MRRAGFPWLALCLAVIAPAAAAEPPAAAGASALTIERIFSEPAIDGEPLAGVRWLPDGTHYSFVERSGEGKDAIFRLLVADAATGATKAVVTSTELPSFGGADRTVRPSLAGATWSPRGDALLLTGDGELFYLPIGGSVRRLTATEAEEETPQFSPDGRFVAFARENDLYAIELASGRELRLSTDGGPNRINGRFDWLYEEELAERDTRAFAWSPDSRAIVYLSLDETRVPRFPIVDFLPAHPKTREEMYPKAGDPNPVPSLRVVPVVAGEGAPPAREIAWNNDGVYLVRLGFVPDGKSAWYELLDRGQSRLELNRLDLATGLSTNVLTETDPAWVNLHDDLYFMKDGRFVWSSEQDGHRHLYLHDAQGRMVRQLTRGDWDVVDSTTDEAAGTVWFTSTETSPIERQLWRVRLDGTAPVRVTQEPGSHLGRPAPGGRFVIDTWSRVDTPKASFLLDAAGKRLRTLGPARVAVQNIALGKVEFVTIDNGTGTKLQGALMKPPQFDPAKKYPVIVYVYGGPHAQVVQDSWGGRTALFHQYLASRGFLVFSVDNRGSFGRGRAFERALLRRFGKVELEDQLAGVAWLRSQPFVDGARIGIWGWSYGGFMTTYALTHTSGVFKAGVAVAPVTDWHFYDSAYTERYLKLPSGNEDGYRDSSPVNAAADLSGALLLVHGTGDDNVHWQNTLAFIDQLYRHQKPYDLQMYANKNHGIPGQEARTHLHTRIAEHFERWLEP